MVLFTFVLHELLHVLGELQQKGDQPGTVVAVLQELRRTAEAMCKSEASASTSTWANWNAIDDGKKSALTDKSPQASATPTAIDDEFSQKLKSTNPAELEKIIAVVRAGNREERRQQPRSNSQSSSDRRRFIT